LHETHQLENLEELVVHTKRLRHLINSLSGCKVIFTNAQRDYALRVLDLLNITNLFELVFSVESAKFHAKPSVRGFQSLLKSIKTKPRDCIMLEGSLTPLMTAKWLGMKTIWMRKTR